MTWNPEDAGERVVQQYSGAFRILAEERTHDELVRVAEEQSLAMLGVPLSTAFEKLDSGQLAGTIAEAELRMLRFLLDD